MENNYQLSRIHNYVMGLMSKDEMYQMERDALDDPFLQDAIEGYRLQKGVDVQQLSLLQQRLARKLEAKAAEKHQRFYSWQRLTIGMAAAVLFLVACSLIFFKYFNQPAVEKNTEVLLMEKDLRVNTKSGSSSDVVPDQNWSTFNEELNSELRDFPGSASIRVTFIVEDGRAAGIQLKGAPTKELDKLVKDFISQKTTWKGQRGDLEITIQ